VYDEKSLQGIGNKIKLLRTLHKISQQELSQQLGVSQTHLCNIENGRVVVNLRLLMRAANLFKCKLDDIISGTFPNEEERAAGSYSSEEVRLLLKMLQVSKSK
jgi:putative transcriptional regulator